MNSYSKRKVLNDDGNGGEHDGGDDDVVVAKANTPASPPSNGEPSPQPQVTHSPSPRPCPAHASLPDDVWKETLGQLGVVSSRSDRTVGLGELKQLRAIAWVNHDHASASLASSHADNWPSIRAHAHDPLYRSQHRRPASPFVID